MQLLIMALLIAVFVHDSRGGTPAAGGPGDVLGWVLLPKLLLMGSFWVLCMATRRRLARPAAHRTLRRFDLLAGAYRHTLLLLYIADLFVFGALTWLRGQLGGNVVLLDEALVMLPTLGALLWSWWAYYPIERRLREASIISRLDAGLPVYPIWTRGQYLLAQARHQVALVLVPMLLLLAWYEAVAVWFGGSGVAGGGRGAVLAGAQGVLPTAVTFAGAGCVFLLAPVMIRHLWDTVPLPAGELHDNLSKMCRGHGVGVRRLLLWRTFGGMVNAAVMGVIAPVRYILLSDALLEHLPRPQVEAVMAHEVAHVRRRHLVWLLVVAAGALMLLELLWQLTAEFLADAVLDALPGAVFDLVHPDDLVQGAVILGTLGCWVLVFGYASRRFERQADTFAVQHLATTAAESRGHSGPVTVDDGSVRTMVEALQQVAQLNHIGVKRRSWRHGSIAWRQAYLRSLAGQRIDALDIDRQVRWINRLSLTAVALAAVSHWLLEALP